MEIFIGILSTFCIIVRIIYNYIRISYVKLGRKLEVEIEESERDLDFLYKKCPIFRGFYANMPAFGRKS